MITSNGLARSYHFKPGQILSISRDSADDDYIITSSDCHYRAEASDTDGGPWIELDYNRYNTSTSCQFDTGWFRNLPVAIDLKYIEVPVVALEKSSRYESPAFMGQRITALPYAFP
jgi:hypothetical protein